MGFCYAERVGHGLTQISTEEHGLVAAAQKRIGHE
jgi:hypothetical protein